MEWTTWDETISNFRGVGGYFFPNINRTFCNQTVKILISCRMMWPLILVCTVCQCPIKRMLGLYGLKLNMAYFHVHYSYVKTQKGKREPLKNVNWNNVSNETITGDKLFQYCTCNFHSSCKHTYLSFKSTCNKKHKGVIRNMTNKVPYITVKMIFTQSNS